MRQPLSRLTRLTRLSRPPAAGAARPIRTIPHPRQIGTEAAAVAAVERECVAAPTPAHHHLPAAQVAARIDRREAAAGPLAEYDRRIRAGQLQPDASQRDIVIRLQALSDQIRSYEPANVTPKPLLKRLFGWGRAETPDSPGATPAGTPRGMYMYGDVGCGKTMLMDLLYDTLPEEIRARSTRVHFHKFMQGVHSSLHALKGGKTSYEGDAVATVAAEIAERSAVLCFDELQCTVISDAMILRRLLQELLQRGVVIVTTSNRVPDDLYRDGIQRVSFLPAIALIKQELDVIALPGGVDYRRSAEEAVKQGTQDRSALVPLYFSPASSEAAASHADKWFRVLADGFSAGQPGPTEISVWGRRVPVPAASGPAARFAFRDLIGGATGAGDYIGLTQRFSRFVLTDVPVFTSESGTDTNLVRRFITFVDALYDARAALALTCAAPVEELYREKNSNTDEEFAFSRTLSRLAEMRTENWLRSANVDLAMATN